MQPRDFIAVKFPQEPDKAYFAEIKKVNANGTFECRFVHSGSLYTFKLETGWLEVVQSSGLFRRGTRTNEVTLFSPIEQQYLAAGGNAAVSFDDGNTYLGRVISLTPGMQIQFLHSGNSYSFDANQVAHHPGSPYDGRKALAIRAYGAGKSLFSDDSDMTISLSIVDGFNKQLSGEFDVILKRTDTDQIVYQNQYMYADDSTASDTLSVTLNDGQNMILLVDFHPANQPYTAHPVSSPDIDRVTTISGSKTFVYKKRPEMHFTVKLQNETATVSATTSENAIRNKYQELTNHATSSTTSEVNLEGSAGIDLLGLVELGGTTSGGFSSTSEHGTSSMEGEGTSSETGSSVTKTWNVYYPMGLEIIPAF